MRMLRAAVLAGFLPLVCAAIPKPADWVPVRWPWMDAASLDLLKGTAVNCVLVRHPAPGFTQAATARGIVTLAVVTPGEDAHAALAAKVDGVVFEGDFPTDPPALPVPVVELAPRYKMKLGGSAPIVGTYQGVWPGIAANEGASAHAGPTSSVWIDTNTGFLRAVRAFGASSVWLANQPPEKTAVSTARYQQVIAEAAISGARWVIAFDADLTARLARREEGALGTWRKITALAAYFESHPEWRAMRENGQLAVVQDPEKGGLLSGGILDMIAVKHTPVRPVAGDRLSPQSLEGATMAVNIEGDDLTAPQKQVLRDFTRSGGMLLNGPPGWKDPTPPAGKITLDNTELARLSDMWKDVNNLIGRRNMGVRLFNVSSMLSNYLGAADGKSAVVHLVNYADYPVESVTLHYLADFPHATLITPEGINKALEVYKTDEGWGVDIDRVVVCATIRLEK
ncbi:MAG: hypothetical protein KGN36_09035 [Acidobacteriota bacterium]|nr:hypothetical protein [Acidobacteriota bacterium]